MPKLKSYKTLQKEFEKKTGKTIEIQPVKYLMSCVDCWSFDEYAIDLDMLNQMIEEHIEEHLSQLNEEEGA